MVSEEYRETQNWSRNKQAVFAVVWISFLSAAIGTMLFFAAFDPMDLAGLVDAEIGANAGYAIGFFFFWLLCAVCSGLTAFLVRTAPKRKTKPGKR